MNHSSQAKNIKRYSFSDSIALVRNSRVRNRNLCARKVVSSGVAIAIS